MTRKPVQFLGGAVLAVAAATVMMARITVPAQAQAPRPAATGIRVDPDDIGGVVTSAKGPEAGVWVIAETMSLPTKFIKIVVTDDQGRFVLPDLPRATYKLWSRGYGLVDSLPVSSTPGRTVNLQAVIAPTARDAAQYFPPSYWFALVQVPPESAFPGTGPQGNGFSLAIKNQAQFVGQFKDSCVICHQMGDKATREIPKEFGFGATGWSNRVQGGQRGAAMSGSLNNLGRAGYTRIMGDWTDRIAAGEFPTEMPKRPTGIERNIVVSRWAWRGEKGTIHDSVSTDKRMPTQNGNGKIYGVDLLNGVLGWVDPVENKAGNVKIPVRDADTPSFAALTMPSPSAYWGNETVWNDPANMHNPMFDAQGRVWLTSSLRPSTRQPAWCKDPNNPFAKWFPIERSGRQTSVYDPKTDKTTLVDTCFGTHHLQFAEDKDNTLYFSGGGNVVGWVKTTVWDQTHNEEKSQGWCPVVLDTNGDGKITKPWNESARQATGGGDGTGGAAQADVKDPKLDTNVTGGAYGIIPNPVDGSVWWANPGTPGSIMRLEIGSNPPETCKAEMYNPPFDANSTNPQTFGYTPRGIDVDRDTGVIWTALSGNGALASFDRRKCKVMNGPTATGDHCREGWQIYLTPAGPQFKGMNHPGSAEMHYFNWVDQHDVVGLGKNVPFANGSNSDAIYALVNGQWVTMRVPYPIGFYTKGMDGRMDDPKTGWKGHGLYASDNSSLSWHLEGGKGMAGGVYRIQLRPDPLAH